MTTVATSLSAALPVGGVARSKRWVMTLVVLPPSPLVDASGSDGVKTVLANRMSACICRFRVLVAEVEGERSPSLQRDLSNRW